MGEDTRLRLAALAAGIACLGWHLLRHRDAGHPDDADVSGAVVMVPLLVNTQAGWTLAAGVGWIVGEGLGTLLGVASRALISGCRYCADGAERAVIAIVPPQVAARRRAAWPFGYLNPRKAAESQGQPERLLLEKRSSTTWAGTAWEDPWTGRRGDEALPLPRKRKAGR